MKRIIGIAVLALFVVATGVFASGQAEGGEDVVTLRLSTNHPASTPPSLGLEVFKKEVASLSDGKINVEIYYNAVLGTEREAAEQVQAGALAMGRFSAGFMNSFVPSLDVFSVPYLFRDKDHFWKVLNGEVGEELAMNMEDSGFKLLYWVESGSRSFYNNIRPVHTPADVEGMTIRVMGSEVMLNTMRTLDANPVTTAYAEVYNALQTGVIDAAENSPISVESMKHYEVVDYFSLNEHMMIPDLTVMSLDVWNTLTAEQQDILEKAAATAEDFTTAEWNRQENAAIKIIKDSGVKVNTLSANEKAAFVEALAPLHKQLSPKFDGLIERIKAVN